MNNIYNDHEFVIKLGVELKPEANRHSYMVCAACGHEVSLAIFYASNDLIRASFSNPCILKRK